MFEEMVELKTEQSEAKETKESRLLGDAVNSEMRKEGEDISSMKGYVVGRKEKSKGSKTWA